MDAEKGLFIVFEGIDGCGKSTQIKKFADYLFNKNKHYHVVLTRNPYKDTDIRGILRQDEDALTQSDKLANLFIEDRRKQAEEIVSPNIEKGHFVISDRYKLSTISYQGAQGIDMNDFLCALCVFVVSITSQIPSRSPLQMSPFRCRSLKQIQRCSSLSPHRFPHRA